MEFRSEGEPVTEELIDSVIANALQERDQEITEPLERLRVTDAEAAALMQEFLDELREARKAGSVVDPDADSMLSEAVCSLQTINFSQMRGMM